MNTCATSCRRCRRACFNCGSVVFDVAVAFHRSEEARLVALVTGCADLFDLNEQRVAVAIERDVLHRLGVAAGLAFHPEFLAGAAPEMSPAGRDCFFQRGAVHPRHHQHAAGGLFLDDGRDQAVGIKFQLVVKTHICCPAYKTRFYGRKQRRAQSWSNPRHQTPITREAPGASKAATTRRFTKLDRRRANLRNP